MRATRTRVQIQDMKVWNRNLKLRPLRPSHRAMPMMPPVMHWELLVGRPYWEAIMMIRLVASSAEKPRDGVSLARRVPTARQTW